MRFASDDQGFIYGSRTAEEFGAFLIAYSIPPTPGTVDNELVIPGRDGTYDDGTDLTRLDLTLQIGLWVPNSGRPAINDAIRRMMALFDPRSGYQDLTINEDPDYYLKAKLTSSTGTSQVNPQPVGNNGEMAAIVDVAMKCNDPHWYSHVEGERTVGSGFVVNPGLAPSPVRLSITAVGASAAGVHKGAIIGGVEVGYSGAMANGETVIIDTDKWTATRAGANVIQGWYGEMPQLPGGDSNVAVVGPCSVQVTFTPRWMA